MIPVTKQNLIDLGIPAESIITSRYPITKINDVTMVAKTIVVNELSDLLNTEFINDKAVVGFIYICEWTGNSKSNDCKYALRYFSIGM